MGMHRKGRVERLPTAPEERAPWGFAGAGELALLVESVIAPVDDEFGYVPASSTKSASPPAAPVPAAYTIPLGQRLAILEDVLASHPGCAVGVFDPARQMIDGPSALAAAGVTASGHSYLKGSALVEFLAVADLGVLSDAATEAGVHGSTTCTLRLRDGHPADLHLIEIGDAERTTVVVIVPNAGATIAPTPPPTAIVASPRIGVLHCDAFGAITSASDSTLVLLGRPETPLTGRAVVDLIHADDQEMAVVNWLAAKEQRGTALRWRCRLIRADGSTLWTEVTITNAIEPDGSGAVDISLYDISAEVAATKALIAERELIAIVTETLPVGVAKFDASGRLEHTNARLVELLHPHHPQRLLERAVCGRLDDANLNAAFATLLHDGAGSLLTVVHESSNGTRRHLEWTIRGAFDTDGAVTGGVLCIADVTEAAQLREALEDRARTDALTGCLNRAGTIAALDRALAFNPLGDGVGLLFIDLNDFKGINDAHGHAVGDAVLQVVAERLFRSLRTDDLVGRLGGDEFVVIATSVGSGAEALDFAGRLSSQLQGPVTIGRATVPISASIGVAWTTLGTSNQLLAAADAAMYVAKHTRSTTPVLSDTGEDFDDGFGRQVLTAS